MFGFIDSQMLRGQTTRNDQTRKKNISFLPNSCERKHKVIIIVEFRFTASFRSQVFFLFFMIIIKCKYNYFVGCHLQNNANIKRTFQSNGWTEAMVRGKSCIDQFSMVNFCYAKKKTKIIPINNETNEILLNERVLKVTKATKEKKMYFFLCNFNLISFPLVKSILLLYGVKSKRI